MHLSSSDSFMTIISSPHFQLKSCWSKAGIGTCIVLEYNNNKKSAAAAAAAAAPARSSSRHTHHYKPCLVLDLGATPCHDHTLRSNTVLLSHGHVDHVGAIFAHARAHSLLCGGGGSVPTYYVPKELTPLLHNAREAMEALDAAATTATSSSTGTRTKTTTERAKLLAMNIVGVEPGEEILLKGFKHTDGVRVFARVFAATHAGCPAVGYVLGTRHPPTLKPEFRGKSQQQIRQALAQGIAIKTKPRDVLEVAYSGDTSIEGLLVRDDSSISTSDADGLNPMQRSALHVQQALQCPLILCEVTFLIDSEKEREMSQKRGHVHLHDIIPLLNQLGGEEGPNVVLLHVSARYTASQILDLVAEAVPPELASRCSVAIRAHARPFEPWKRLVRYNGCISLSEYVDWKAESSTASS